MHACRICEREEERDDVKRGKFLGLALRRMDLALTKDYEGEGQIDRQREENEAARLFRIKIDWNMIRNPGARARRVL